MEQRMDLYQGFVDLPKRFHAANRIILWKILGKLGFQKRFVNMLRCFHGDTKAWVNVCGLNHLK